MREFSPNDLAFPATLAERIAESVVNELENRKGFDAWFYGEIPDDDIRDEILEDLADRVQRELDSE